MKFKSSSAGKGSCVARAIALVFVIIGAVVTGFGAKNVMQARESSNWPRTKGVILESDVESKRKRSNNSIKTTYHAEIHYEYEVDGVTYNGNRVAFGDLGSSDPSHARSIVNRYPEGKEIEVAYLEDDPAECVIETGVHGQTWFLPGIGAAFLLVGAFTAIRLWGGKPQPTHG